MKVARFDPSPFGFPKPRISPLPNRLQIKAFGDQEASDQRKKTAGQFRTFRRGRYALGEAYRLAGLNQDATLLAPAYHCLTMLDPAINLGANVLLYPVRADLSPDLDNLDTIARNASRPIKALLATHFFGIAVDFAPLKQWCTERGIVLIEDCSHALFTRGYGAAGTGIYGEYVVSSPYKFFTCKDAGLLFAQDGRILNSVKTFHPGLMEELCAIKYVIESHRSGSASPAGIEEIGQSLTDLLQKHPEAANVQTTQYDSYPTGSFSAANARKSSLRSSEWLIRLSSVKDITKRRRDNFRQWLEAVAGLANCRPLYRDLPEGCIPYMFPLYIDHPDTHFPLLKYLGVPIWRWDNLAVSSSLIANDYRLHLIHLPCHQSLSEEQMAWMIAAVREVMLHSVPEAD